MRTHCAKHADQIILHGVDPTNKKAGFLKPFGFWYEVDGDWRRWCRDDSGWEYEYLHVVDLADCNILVIDTVAKLDAFHVEYVGPYENLTLTEAPDWRRVAEKYDGIEIAPYQWSRRLAMNMLWYYGWDCASGVIWCPRSATVTLLDQVEVPA